MPGSSEEDLRKQQFKQRRRNVVEEERRDQIKSGCWESRWQVWKTESPWRRFERRLSDTVVASSRHQNTVSGSQSLELGPENFPSHQVLLAWLGELQSKDRCKESKAPTLSFCAVQGVGGDGSRAVLGLVGKHLVPGSKADLWAQPPILAVPLACWPIYICTGGTQDCKRVLSD